MRFIVEKYYTFTYPSSSFPIPIFFLSFPSSIFFQSLHHHAHSFHPLLEAALIDLTQQFVRAHRNVAFINRVEGSSPIIARPTNSRARYRVINPTIAVSFACLTRASEPSLIAIDLKTFPTVCTKEYKRKVNIRTERG